MSDYEFGFDHEPEQQQEPRSVFVDVTKKLQEEEIRRLRKQTEELKEETYELRDENKRLKSQVLSFDKKLRRYVEDIDELKSSQNEVEQLKEKYEELKKENTKLIRTQSSQHKSQKDINLLKEKVEELKNENSALKSQSFLITNRNKSKVTELKKALETAVEVVDEILSGSDYSNRLNPPGTDDKSKTRRSPSKTRHDSSLVAGQEFRPSDVEQVTDVPSQRRFTEVPTIANWNENGPETKRSQNNNNKFRGHQQLRELFDREDVEDIRFIPQKTFAHIDFNSEHAFNRAMDLNGTNKNESGPLRVSHARPR
ncbi:17979_t:CDS:10 [Funneliformis geosporum]|uniref:18804_t:CDS:1 n=1 Tax=Funneliformis geosporum TaxID=1117311 RepID=A0A9W4SW68_9GLOM|nr:17979_t:CDS:10 [Funneliformis geosporum]CAI2185575.1 18804_t:CDS:10 [Funneliformis geosporum]